MITDGGVAPIFVAVDHGSIECVGLHAARRATRFEALEPIRQGVRERFGAFAEGIAGGLNPDAPFQSHRRARTPQESWRKQGFPCSPVASPTIRPPDCSYPPNSGGRIRAEEFRRRYNETWLVARHGYRAPAQVRADQLGALVVRCRQKIPYGREPPSRISRLPRFERGYHLFQSHH